MKISKEKQDKIKEAILAYLFLNSPKSFFTVEIAREIARDEEFSKKLLGELSDNGFVIAVKKNAKGKDYKRRIRWRISQKVHKAYKDLANKGIEVYR